MAAGTPLGPQPSRESASVIAASNRATASPASGSAPVLEADRPEARRVGATGDAAALRDRAAVDLLDVAREVDRRGAADVRADRVRVDWRARLLEDRHAVRVQPARDDDLDVREARLVEAGADLADQVRRHAAALRRRV